jgi:hypothetical protein
MRPGFKACYNKGLSVDPSMSGKVTMTVKIGPNGEVASVTPNNQGLSSEVVECISRKLRNAQFDPPGGGGSTVTIPVTFVKQ